MQILIPESDYNNHFNRLRKKMLQQYYRLPEDMKGIMPDIIQKVVL
jgi:hypothetical protein